MKFSKRLNYALLTFLTLLNIVFRYPFTPHELGADSFFIHGLANSISVNGYANWIINPLSILGLYPFSYTSGGLYFLSGVGIVTGFNLEQAILFTSICFGVFGGFTSYLMAGEINNDSRFKLLVAFIFSLSPLALKFTVWTMSTRGLFLVFLPLFIWSLLRYHRAHEKKQFMVTAILFILLVMTHRMFTLTILIVAAYLLTVFIERYRKKITLPKRFLNFVKSPYTITMLFVFVFLSPFFFSKGWWAQEYLPFSGDKWYCFLVGTIFTTGARLGFIIPFALFGLFLLIWNRHKDFKTIFLLFVLLFFTPTLSYMPYAYQFLLPFLSLLAGISIIKITDFVKIKNVMVVMVVLLLLLHIVFSGYTLWYRYTNVGSFGVRNYAEDETCSAAIFLKEYSGGVFVTTDTMFGYRITAYSGVPVFPGRSAWPLAYSFVDDVEIVGLAEFTLASDYIYVANNTAQNDYDLLLTLDCDNDTAKGILSKYNIHYYIENNNIQPQNPFFKSVREKKYKMYDDGVESIWYLGWYLRGGY